MNIPSVVAWPLTAAFLALTVPCVGRLVRLDYGRLGGGARQSDLAWLLMMLAMVAMVSPVGGPIPVAGWQALFVLCAGWFAVRAFRRVTTGAGDGGAHHAVASAGMLYMLVAMPHDESAHDLFVPMSAAGDPATFGWPAVAVVAAAYFAVDGGRAALSGLRAAGHGEGPPRGSGSRALCRAAMGLGMGYMFLTGL
ncbi:uncharacterized protein DUF5134 [Prauserella shujinwangii]|uniref:Uncharacterized protein DUF5134 n=1 Tax=Prauserella shujinwangii TaxID=1453103 RepID=A0A2T0M376_9PSEU|nr:DUF5134 domain-containing protein [Prauserella shujinwangii]PRX51198.1 uncharacterized protein DUF5134 [Prauserella shujinwangii]